MSVEGRNHGASLDCGQQIDPEQEDSRPIVDDDSLSSTRSITSTAETSVCRSKCIYITYLDRSCQLERERPTA